MNQRPSGGNQPTQSHGAQIYFLYRRLRFGRTNPTFPNDFKRRRSLTLSPQTPCVASALSIASFAGRGPGYLVPWEEPDKICASASMMWRWPSHAFTFFGLAARQFR